MASQKTPANKTAINNKKTALNTLKVAPFKGDFIKKADATSINRQTLINSSASTPSYFKIRYFTAAGVAQYIHFALMPVVNPEGEARSIPEATPGIMINQKMKRRHIIVPGAAPVVQTIGIDRRDIKIVGLITGAEAISSNSSLAKSDLIDSYGGIDNKTAEKSKIALNSGNFIAKVINTEVILPGRPVQFEMFSTEAISLSSNSSDYTPSNVGDVATVSLSGELIVESFRRYVSRHDRVYYTLEGLITDFYDYKEAGSII